MSTSKEIRDLAACLGPKSRSPTAARSLPDVSPTTGRRIVRILWRTADTILKTIMMNEALIRLLFLVHLGTTLFMVGLIWFVQVVHYPLFAMIGRTEFPEYEQRHASQTTWVVAPPMLLELGTAVLLFWFRPAGISDLQCGVGLGLLLLIWLSTRFLQVPYHTTLSKGFDPLVHRMLLTTNCVRTTASAPASSPLSRERWARPLRLPA